MVCANCVSKTFLDGVFVLCEYDNLIRKLAHIFKFSFYFEAAAVFEQIIEKNQNGKLTEFMAKGKKEKDFYVAPIPLHKKRFAERGFNQSEILARHIAKVYHMQIDSESLRRIKNTDHQSALSREQRLQNVKNCFETRKKAVDKKFLLVDDVFTTGATMEEAARVLKNQGARKVYGLAIARGASVSANFLDTKSV